MDNSSSNKQPKQLISEAEASAESLALQVAAYFDALRRNGLTREEALHLATAYQTSFWHAVGLSQQKRSG